MTTTSTQPPDLTRYLARRGFAPNPGNPTWLEATTGPLTIRVLHQPGETTLLYCLDSRQGCLFEAVFSPGTPDALLTAAIEAALSTPPPPPSLPRTRSATGRRRTREEGR